MICIEKVQVLCQKENKIKERILKATSRSSQGLRPCICEYPLTSIQRPYQLYEAPDYDLVWWNMRGSGQVANFNRPWSIVYSLPHRIPCRLFIHQIFSGPLGLHLLVWGDLLRSWPFRPMRDLRMQWSRAINLVGKVTLMPPPHLTLAKPKSWFLKHNLHTIDII